MRIQTTLVLLVVFALQGCTGFHLRNSTNLPSQFQQMQLQGVSDNNDFVKALTFAIEEAGGSLNTQASSQLKLSNIREDKRIVAYDSDRKARVYLLSLKLNYEVVLGQKDSSLKKLKPIQLQRLNLDRTFVYDADFALGKAEEEKQIRQTLYAEAARLILLRLRYHQ